MTTVLVLGGGACIWRDVEAALELGEFDAVVTCNDITATWPGPVDAAVSLHPEKWPLWLERRDRNGLPRPARLFGHTVFTKSTLKHPDLDLTFTDHCFAGQVDSGSSGLFALKVALIDLNFDRAVLCGVPMDEAEGHFFDPKRWGGAASHRRGWTQALPQLVGRARSMSGWTSKRLGRPDKQWMGVSPT